MIISVNFDMMSKIRVGLLALFLAVVLIQGEFTVDLDEDNLRNAIIIRINDTAECQTVSDVFPEPTIATEERSNSDQIVQLSSILPRRLEPVLVTIYNVRSDKVCDSRRKHLLTDSSYARNNKTNSTIPNFQIYSVCIQCSEESDFSSTQLIRKGTPGFSSFSATRRLAAVSEQQSCVTTPETYKANAHYIKLAEGRRSGFTIRVDPNQCLISERATSTSRRLQSTTSYYYGIGTSGGSADNVGSLYGIGHSDGSVEASLPGSVQNEARQETLGIGRFNVQKSVNSKVECGENEACSQANTSQSVQGEGFGGTKGHSSKNTSDLFNLFDSPPEELSVYTIGVDNSDGKIVAGETETETGITLSAMDSRIDPRPQDCSLQFDECCDDGDCVSNNNICVARTCITEGNPRITLVWIGDDDYDLFVMTPDGVLLSYNNHFDPATGGRVGEPVEQNGAGYHVESVYFPLGGAPPGPYSVYVRPLTTVGVSDTWILTVSDEKGEVVREMGSGFSSTITYERESLPTGDPKPTIAPIIPPTSKSCNSLFDECCRDSDCLFQGEICVHRTCIDDGNPRITLKWIGDDDLDLFVETPGGAELSFNNFFDPATGGRFGEDVDQFGSGYHVENVYFPKDNREFGTYRFFARPLTTVGDQDQWTLTVVESGQTIITKSGFGPSDIFYYVRTAQPALPTLPPIKPTKPPALPTRPDPPTNPPTAPSPSSPNAPPTRPPQDDDDDDDCSAFFDECCVDSDCQTTRDLCEQRTCIREGNPRFSLIWTGDDDLDLYVITANGIEISSANTFDIFSGGRFERDVDQSEFGRHVENIYFPVLGTPSGLYTFGARSVSTQKEPDFWVVEVFEDGELVRSEEGTGDSISFSYDRDDQFEGPQRPQPSPPRCSPISDECCLDSDCSSANEICVQRTCIDEGNPRITLRWTGDDDLDLFVQTPNGDVLSRVNTFDQATGGRYGEDPNQSEFGFHVESIFFPPSGAPLGTYTFFVDSAVTRGIGADIWEVTIYEKGEQVLEQTGIGNSREFTYERFIQLPPSLPPPTVPTFPSPQNPPISPPITERPPVDTPVSLRPCPHECCSDSDCNAPDELCAQRTCIREGTPRFTLTWTGNDDLNLVVVAPNGATISYQNPFDNGSGGSFAQDSDPFDFGFHVESIVFAAAGGQEGRYNYFVKSFKTEYSADRWALRVYVDGHLVAWNTGTGDSRSFSYQYGAQQNFPTPAPIVNPPIPSSYPIQTRPPAPPSTNLCEADSDCRTSQEVCVQKTCIDEGNPRFTLVWSGNDDLDFFVVTPLGTTISSTNAFDSLSGGIFGEAGDQMGFGLYVENIYFPLTGGPQGTYSYYVKGSTSQGSDDSWVASVFIDGIEQVAKQGSGDSPVFTYEFEEGFQLSPTPAPGPGECLADTDCRASELCILRTCIDDGSPRVTLSWTGDDDLDLYVVTPAGKTISASNPYDQESGGIFGEEGVQTGFGNYVENVYFSPGQGPFGKYSYFVRSFRTSGTDDLWTLRVNAHGSEISIRSGVGSSATFTFDFGSFVEPTSAPTKDNVSCNPSPDECCVNEDCLVTEVCTQRVCIDKGTPRFTLTWTGNDDLDLKVLTPLGTVVSFANPVDSESGGILGTPSDQFDFGRHVENIFFPSTGGPPGTYSYHVQSFLPEGVDDIWKVCVFVGGQEETCTSGRGSSSTLTYFLESLPPSFVPPSLPPVKEPTLEPLPLPTAAPDDCDVDKEECCSDSACFTGVEICVQRTCIDLGNPRFTLTWTGNDDLDLSVQTSIGTTISFTEPVDFQTGGVYGEDGSQFVNGRHVENIFFAMQKAPKGVYSYGVSTFTRRGGDDEWTVAVYVSNIEVASQSGSGDSVTFTYDFTDDSIVPGQSPGPGCNTNIDECCADSDCIEGQELCVQRSCIDRGNPRFTLTWTGDDDLDLAVVTPFGSTVAISNPDDEISGGIFGEPGDQFQFGYHVESIFFPQTGGPSGAYTYFVSSFDEIGTADTWTVSVHVDDVLVALQTGTGTSDFLVFDYSEGTVRPPTNPPNEGSIDTPTDVPIIIGCNIELDECCNDTDCSGTQLCVQRTCIDEGNPRFTLSWNGNDDYDLTVTPPIGSTISFLNQVDEDSGGRFGEDGVQLFTGLHVENVFFPSQGGPIGAYTYQVQKFNIIGDEDTWTVRVYVGGEQVDSISGKGNSGTLTYEYISGSNLAPTKVRSCSPLTDECCNDSDCGLPNEICTQRTCILDGNPRFTLTWTGDDDLDLSAVTPSGGEVSYFFPFDVGSSGIFGESGSQFGFGPHAENIFFPTTGSPPGTYKYRVKSFNQIGENDSWTVQVFVDGEEVDSHTGMGDSQGEFEYNYEPESNTVIRAPGDSGTDNQEYGVTPECSTASEECCTNSDCSSDNGIIALCINHTCYTGGALRFTLGWKGSGELKVSVIAPGFSSMYSSNELSSGDAKWEIKDQVNGMNVRSLYFQTAPVFGVYSFSIGRVNVPFDGEWYLWVHVEGEQVFARNGTSVGSTIYTYDYTG